MSRRFFRHEKEKWTAEPARPAKRSPIRIAEIDTSEIIEGNRLTLIGQNTKPLFQKPRAVVDFLPQVLDLVERVVG